MGPFSKGIFIIISILVYNVILTIKIVLLIDFVDCDIFISVFQCLGIWDLDIRGHYKGMWRLYLNRFDSDNQEDTIGEEGIITHNKSGIELFIIGCPFSYFWYVCFIFIVFN